MIESIKKQVPEGITVPSELETLCKWEVERGYPISGYFELRAGDGKDFYYWFGSHDADPFLALFGAGSDGSMFCIWKQEDGRQPIVHLGSEGDEVKVLAENMKEFIKLLAVGYGEIGHEDTSKPPEEKEGINPDFQCWVRDDLGLEIPETGDVIIQRAIASHDDFAAWVETKTN